MFNHDCLFVWVFYVCRFLHCSLLYILLIICFVVFACCFGWELGVGGPVRVRRIMGSAF